MPTTPKKSSKLKPAATWRDKLERPHPSHGKIVTVPSKKNAPSGTLLIPRPLDLDALIRKVRPGKIITQGDLRAKLAAAAGADNTCPLCTGIFLRIIAEAAEEDRAAGKTRITPYWRAVKDDGSLNEKFPGGSASHARLLRAEGHTFTPAKGAKPPRVTLPAVRTK